MSGSIKEKKAQIKAITRECYYEYSDFAKLRKARVIDEMHKFYEFWNISRQSEPSAPAQTLPDINIDIPAFPI